MVPPTRDKDNFSSALNKLDGLGVGPRCRPNSWNHGSKPGEALCHQGSRRRASVPGAVRVAPRDSFTVSLCLGHLQRLLGSVGRKQAPPVRRHMLSVRGCAPLGLISGQAWRTASFPRRARSRHSCQGGQCGCRSQSAWAQSQSICIPMWHTWLAPMRQCGAARPILVPVGRAALFARILEEVIPKVLWNLDMLRTSL